METKTPETPAATFPIQPKGGLQKFFHHPNFNVAVGIIGTLLSVFGVYAYYSSIKEPNLTYYVSSTRSPIVKTGSFRSGFVVTYQGKEIKTDLSAATIQIWNAGKQVIRKEDILKPIRIQLENKAPVYQVEVSQTREVIGVQQHVAPNPETNSVALTWDILENGDSVKIQIIYAGSTDVPILVDGLVVGQKGGLFKCEPNRSLPFHFVAGFFIVVLGVGSALIYFMGNKWIDNHIAETKWQLLANFCFTMGFVFVAVTFSKKFLMSPFLTNQFNLNPPFGF